LSQASCFLSGVDAAWVRSIRDQCTRNSIAFHHKQRGGLWPKQNGCLLDGGRRVQIAQKLPRSGSVPTEIDLAKITRSIGDGTTDSPKPGLSKTDRAKMARSVGDGKLDTAKTALSKFDLPKIVRSTAPPRAALPAHLYHDLMRI